MKRFLLAMVLIGVMSLGMSSCIATRDTAKINKVELGMSKSDIKHLLGTPLFRNADENGEEWGYRKEVGKVTNPEKLLFIVSFDPEGKVIAYNSVKDFPSHHPY